MKKLFLFLILGAPTLLMGQDSLEILEVEIQDNYKEIKLIPGKILPTQMILKLILLKCREMKRLIA